MLILPLHPKLVHFPIAFVVGGMLFALGGAIFSKADYFKTARMLLYLAVFFSLAALASGWFEAARLHLKHPVLYAHRFYAFLLTGLLILATGLQVMIKGEKRDLILLVSLIISSVIVGLCAHWGGKLVYEYGMGVSP